MTDWNPCVPVNQSFIPSERLLHETKRILITTVNKKGKRKVMLVSCNHGRIQKKFDGEIVAWADEPTPYR